MKSRRGIVNKSTSQYTRSVSQENGMRRYIDENGEVEDHTHVRKKDLEVVEKAWGDYPLVNVDMATD